MESNGKQQSPEDPRAELAVADQARQRLSGQLRLPSGLHPLMAGAVAIQIGTAAYGIASQTIAGLVVALVGVAVFLVVAALMLFRFRRTNGVRVDGLASQLILGTGPTPTLAYVAAFGAATWAAFDSRWWLVAVAAVAGGAGYELGVLGWWRAYQRDSARHTGGATPRVLAALAAVACLGFVALLIAS